MYEDIRALFEKELCIPANDVCRTECDARYKNPALPFHIGSQYPKSDVRLVVLRDAHRGDQRMSRLDSGLKDGRALADRLYQRESKANWSYLRAFLEHIHGSAEAGWDRVALLGLVKCTNVGRANASARRTSAAMRESCLRHLGVVQRELQILQPTHILAVLDATFDPFLDDLRWQGDQAWWDLSARDTTASCGKAKVAWYERELMGRDGRVRFLRVSPPQGKPRDPYLQMLTRWVTFGEIGLSPA